MTVALLIGIGVLAVGAYLALRNAQDFSDANEIVPGVATKAPKGWAGAHSPEARMHRRLRDAIVALRANESLDDPAMAPVRSSIEEQALGVDERLIAAAALAKAHREEPLRQIDKAVRAIEGAVASVVELRGPSMGSIEQGLADVQARMINVEAARAELEALSPTSSTLDAIRAHIEDETPAVAETPAVDETPDDDDPGTAPSV